MKIGIIQMQMSWTIEENLRTISEHVKNLDDLDVLLFPELALCGFHRKVISESNPDVVQYAIQSLCQLAREYKKILFLGAPITRTSGIFNSYLCISDSGEILAQWDKSGLTPSESTFFANGGDRTVISLGASTATSIICREAEDMDWFISQMGSQIPTFVVWPSYIGNNQEGSELQGYLLDVSAIAQKLGTFVIQCNWPHALNDDELSGLGGSRVFDSEGNCIGVMPIDSVAIGVLDLTDSSFEVVNTERVLQPALQ